MGMAAFRLLAPAPRTRRSSRRRPTRAGPPAFAEAGQRIFVDLTGLLRSRVGRAFMPRVFDLMEARSATVLRACSTAAVLARPTVAATDPAAGWPRSRVRYRVPVVLARR